MDPMGNGNPMFHFFPNLGWLLYRSAISFRASSMRDSHDQALWESAPSRQARRRMVYLQCPEVDGWYRWYPRKSTSPKSIAMCKKERTSSHPTHKKIYKKTIKKHGSRISVDIDSTVFSLRTNCQGTHCRWRRSANGSSLESSSPRPWYGQNRAPKKNEWK